MKKRKLNQLALKKIIIAQYKFAVKGGMIDTSCGDKNCACYSEGTECEGTAFGMQ